MPETEPLYFTQFKISTENSIKKIEESISDLATMIKDNVAMKSDLEDLATKEDIKDMVTKDEIKNMATTEDIDKLLKHIGAYEVRAKNVEDILIQDHKPRIIELEKKVFA